MPANGCAPPVFIDQDHGERLWCGLGPFADARTEWHQEFRNGRGPLAGGVGQAEERHSAARDRATHFEVRELDRADFRRKGTFFGERDEIVAVQESRRQVGFEK